MYCLVPGVQDSRCTVMIMISESLIDSGAEPAAGRPGGGGGGLRLSWPKLDRSSRPELEFSATDRLSKFKFKLLLA